MAQKAYGVESFILGSKSQGDQIVFASIEDMEQAYKVIDNGKDIYIEKDGGSRGRTTSGSGTSGSWSRATR